MTRSTRTPNGSKPHESATADFTRAVSDLRDRASAVVKLGRQGIRSGIVELDRGSGDLERKILVLMDDIESSFRTIRRRLGA
jgi:hypothetical protein